MLSGLYALFVHVSFFFTQSKNYLPRDSIAHSGLDLPYLSIIKKIPPSTDFLIGII